MAEREGAALLLGYSGLGAVRGSSTIVGLQWCRGSEREQHYCWVTVVWSTAINQLY